ncbi:MAG: hypothetical protein ACREDO_07720 [Methyloceanibacter sp.]
MAGLLLPVETTKQSPTAPPHKLKAVLCKSEDQAIALAAGMASNKTETIAVNLVNKSAGAEVCGRYIGHVKLEVQKTTNQGGGLFMLAGLLFVEDNAIAWTANWIAPFQGVNLEQGT